MPNHIHILITISADAIARIHSSNEAFELPVSGSIPTIVRSYKAAVTQRILAMRDAPVSKVWHHNYYEPVVRNENERERIFLYIITNPEKWDSDEENPVGKSKDDEHG